MYPKFILVSDPKKPLTGTFASFAARGRNALSCAASCSSGWFISIVNSSFVTVRRLPAVVYP